MNSIVVYLITGTLILIGLMIVFKEAGWPSERERKNRIMRSFWSAAGGTVLCTGLILAVTSQSSPSSLFTDLSIASVIRFVFLIVVPLFCVLLVGSFVQYTVWDRTESFARDRLQKIVEADKKRKSKS